MKVKEVHVGPGAMMKKVGANISCNGGYPDNGSDEEFYACSFKPNSDGTTVGTTN